MMNNAFAETRNLFMSYTHYERPLSFEEWMRSPQDSKAALLYVQYYEEITLAWYKSKSWFAVEEEGVETILQYLMKNVPVIEQNPNRFTSGYIYRVAYNCLYCISHDRKCDIERWERETSNVVGYNGDELDLFDTVTTNLLGADEALTSENFWAIIEDMGIETWKVVNYLLNEGQTLKKTKFRMKNPETLATWEKKTQWERNQSMETYKNGKNNYEIDILRDIEVSVEEMENIIEELRIKLDKFKEVYYL